MELKMEAARRRTSVAALVREKVTKERRPKKRNTAQFMKDLDKFAKQMARESKGISFSEGLIKMRYEQ